MKIIFVYPSLSDASFNTEGKPILFNQTHRGLCCLSAVCRKEGFNDIGLIDLRLLRGWEEFRGRVEREKPDVAGITVMSPDYEYAVKCIDIIKEASPGTKTVAGGMHPTIRTEEMAGNKNVDHIITGEGETAFVELVKQIEKGKAPERIIKGELADVDKIPFEDRELFDFLEKPYEFFLPPPFVTVLASRGCPYYCKFCAPGSKLLHGNRTRRRSVDSVIGELKELHRQYGFRSLQFWDDCFGVDRNWVMEFCDKYKKEGFRQPFICLMRADIICRNPDMMKKLRKAGLVMALIGFETGNERMLKFVNKGTTLKQHLKATKICKRLGIKIWAMHMFGLPTETNEEARDTARIIKKIKPYRSSTAFFTPFPGSFFYEYCKENNLSLIGDHDAVAIFPEDDTPKIKNIDYNFMRKLATDSKNLPLRSKVRIRIERIFAPGAPVGKDMICA